MTHVRKSLKILRIVINTMDCQWLFKNKMYDFEITKQKT